MGKLPGPGGLTRRPADPPPSTPGTERPVLDVAGGGPVIIRARVEALLLFIRSKLGVSVLALCLWVLPPAVGVARASDGPTLLDGVLVPLEILPRPLWGNLQLALEKVHSSLEFTFERANRFGSFVLKTRVSSDLKCSMEYLPAGSGGLVVYSNLMAEAATLLDSTQNVQFTTGLKTRF